MGCGLIDGGSMTGPASVVVDDGAGERIPVLCSNLVLEREPQGLFRHLRHRLTRVAGVGQHHDAQPVLRHDHDWLLDHGVVPP
jgi:hypothetical protein